MLDLEKMALDLVSLEAQLLDRQEWTEWLNLYVETARIWIPMWKDDSTLTADPDAELSFMYLENKDYLRERVNRISSGLSVALTPVPRVCHIVGRGHVVIDPKTRDASVKSSWMSNVYHQKDNALTHYAGHYEHKLELVDDCYQISLKKIVVINDRLQSQVEFYYF